MNLKAHIGAYLVAGALAGVALTGVALAHDTSGDEQAAADPSRQVPALELNAEPEFVPIAGADGGAIKDASGAVALVRRAAVDDLLAQLAKEGAGGRAEPGVAATVRIADYFDRLVASGAVEFVDAHDPRLLAYCTVEAQRSDTCAP
jgi:hypothetical protein